MEMNKALKMAGLVVAAAGVLITGGMFFQTKKADAQLPEYVGTQACIGCHAGKVDRLENMSKHPHMVTQVVTNKDLPADPATAPAELQAEIAKADWVVAGQRFLARDPVSGDLKYLNVQYDTTKKQYVAYKGGSDWNTGCAGCHSTGYNVQTKTFAEPGIGCEMCHGPARDHILGKGDTSKITVSTDSAVCGQCHNGSGKNADGVSWPVGYRPNMKSLSDVGFVLPTVDPNATVPQLNSPKLRQYSMWQASKHADAMKDLTASDHASAACLTCHSTQGAADVKAGKKDIKVTDPAYQDAISCVMCHSPHGSKNEAQLKSDPKTLCESCHTGGIKEGDTFKAGSTVHHPMKEMLEGYGAIGVAPTAGAHTGKACSDCHMTEGNHEMKIIKPSEVEGTDRKDTCTTCHTNSSPESREAYLNLWQDSITGKLEAIKADKAVIDAAVKANPNLLTPELKTKYNAASTNESFVEADSSKGAHNFEYAVKIVTAAQKDMAAVKAAIGK